MTATAIASNGHQRGGGEPLARFPAFASTDLGSFRRYLARSYCDHHVRQRAEGTPVDACHNRLPLSEMSLNFLRYGSDVEIDIGPFKSFYMLEVPQSGSVKLHLGDARLETRPGLAAVISPTVPVWSNWSADCAQLMIKIGRDALEAHLSRLLGRALPHELLFDPVLDLATPEGASLVGFARFLAGEFGTSAGMLCARGMSRDLEHAFMSALLTTQPSNYSDLLRTRASVVRPRHVRRAVEYIEANLQNEIALDAIVAASGVSARALYAGFHNFVGMPPQVLVKNLRLDRVREDLAAARGGITVAEVAMRWQFSHLGRFSSDYRARFGESPRETLRH